MIVTCQNCGTRFNLDESLIARELVKVRCSHCQQVFTVSRPESGPEPLETKAAPEEESSGTATLDLPPEEPAEMSASLAKAEALVAGEADDQAESAPSQDEPAPFPLEPAAEEPKRLRPATVLLIVSGCLLGLLLGVLALWYAGGKEAGPLSAQTAKKRPKETLALPLPPASPEELRKLAIELKDARYKGLVNAKGGQLLVIQGEVKNRTGEPRGPIRLKATLTDALHQPVQELLFYSGTSLSDEELLRTDPEEIKRWLATPGGRGGTRVVKPDGSQNFTGVFFGVPDNLAEARHGFTIVVIEGPQTPVE